MEFGFLHAMWLLWLDGWTFTHWVSIVWTVSTTVGLVGAVATTWLNWRDTVRWRRNLSR